MFEKTIPTGGNALRILLVDDNPHVLSALMDLFEDERDVRIVGAALRVDDAITLAVAHAPDAVLVDVNMPDGGGARFVEAVRASCPDIRIVALSAYLESQGPGRVNGIGADLHLPKNTDMKTLMRSLKK